MKQKVVLAGASLLLVAGLAACSQPENQPPPATPAAVPTPANPNAPAMPSGGTAVPPQRNTTVQQNSSTSQ